MLTRQNYAPSLGAATPVEATAAQSVATANAATPAALRRDKQLATLTEYLTHVGYPAVFSETSPINTPEELVLWLLDQFETFVGGDRETWYGAYIQEAKSLFARIGESELCLRYTLRHPDVIRVLHAPARHTGYDESVQPAR